MKKHIALILAIFAASNLQAEIKPRKFSVIGTQIMCIANADLTKDGNLASPNRDFIQEEQIWADSVESRLKEVSGINNKVHKINEYVVGGNDANGMTCRVYYAVGEGGMTWFQ